MPLSIRNIAIMAHADAGKTTITEQFLFLGGQTRRPGSVDRGTAQTDFLPVEQERGISVKSAETSFEWKGHRINLADTPGHVDFSSELERMLRIPEAVILVLSAVEGVQAHTRTIWTALTERKIPVIFFVNKVDRMGADTMNVLTSIKKELGVEPFVAQEISDEGTSDVGIIQLWNPEKPYGALVERVVVSDEAMLNEFLEGRTPAFHELDQQLMRLVQSRNLFLLMFGSAKNGLGLRELLNGVVTYFPPPSGNLEEALSALVYGIGFDKTMGRVAHVRVFQGRISSRDTVYNHTRQLEEKVTQVQRIFPGKYESTGLVEAGDVAGICGLSETRLGDILGEPHQDIPQTVKVRTPLLTVQIKADNPRDYASLAAAMAELSAEDPALEFEWLKEEAELHLKIMGWIQMEVLERILADRFGIAARFGNPTVIYKETPSKTAEGFVQYWMPKPCWAVMTFLIEPGERGSGVVYHSKVSVNDVLQKYQNEVEKCILAAVKQGIKGWEVTDIRITLVAGEDHSVHSRPGDFTVATPMGIMNGLVNSGTTLLEPVLKFQIEAAEELLGAVTSDITRMRGSFDTPEMTEGKFILRGIVPLATSMDFPVKLSSRSGGKATISTWFHGYSTCADEQGVIREYKGISPLDTAKYILKARKAIQ